MELVKLTDAQVRAIKLALMRGTHPIALAQAYGVGAESVRRIKRGETHTRVRVVGEEMLRPEMFSAGVVGEGAVPGADRSLLGGLPPMTRVEEEAAEASAQRVIAAVAVERAGKVVEQEVSAFDGALEMMLKGPPKG